MITLIIVAIAAINIRGIRQSSLVVNVLTVGKLMPLVIFIAAGLFAIDRVAPGHRPAADARRPRPRAGCC